jgi:hypothetical protein
MRLPRPAARITARIIRFPDARDYSEDLAEQRHVGRRNGDDRSGCHIIPVMGWAEWRIALTTPSSATAQTSSGGRESKAAK